MHADACVCLPPPPPSHQSHLGIERDRSCQTEKIICVTSVREPVGERNHVFVLAIL